MADNKVFFKDKDIVEIQVVGDQDEETITQMGRDVSILLAKQRTEGRKCLVLDDLLRIGEVTAEGRQKVVNLGKSLDYDRLAMVGGNALLRISANLMLHAVGRAGKIRYFQNREGALRWLSEIK